MPLMCVQFMPDRGCQWQSSLRQHESWRYVIKHPRTSSASNCPRIHQVSHATTLEHTCQEQMVAIVQARCMPALTPDYSKLKGFVSFSKDTTAVVMAAGYSLASLASCHAVSPTAQIHCTASSALAQYMPSAGVRSRRQSTLILQSLTTQVRYTLLCLAF